MHKNIIFMSCIALYFTSLHAMDTKEGETLVATKTEKIRRSPTLTKIPKTSPRTHTIQGEYTLDHIANTKPSTVSPRTWRNTNLSKK